MRQRYIEPRESEGYRKPNAKSIEKQQQSIEEVISGEPKSDGFNSSRPPWRFVMNSMAQIVIERYTM